MTNIELPCPALPSAAEPVLSVDSAATTIIQTKTISIRLLQFETISVSRVWKGQVCMYYVDQHKEPLAKAKLSN